MQRRTFLQGLFAVSTSSLMAMTAWLWPYKAKAEDAKPITTTTPATNTATPAASVVDTSSTATAVGSTPITPTTTPTPPTASSSTNTNSTPTPSVASTSSNTVTTPANATTPISSAPTTPVSATLAPSTDPVTSTTPTIAPALTGVPALDAKSLDEAYQMMAMSPEPSKDITIKAPELAENGSIIPVRITTSIPDTQQILIVVPENPYPLAAAFFLHKGMEPMAYTRIRMLNDSTILAIIKTTREAYVAKHLVKVAVSDCDV